MVNIFQKILDTYIINFHNKRIIKAISLTEYQTVLDVGSHKAEFFRTLLRQNLDVKKYISFEPIKKLYQNLFNEFESNLQFEVLNIGLSSVKGFKNINVNIFSSTSTFSEINTSNFKYKLKNLLAYFSIFDHKESESESVEVDLLDNLELEIRNYVDLVIIDVEGHELEVLNGALNFFKKYNPKYIVIEINKKDSYKNYNPEKVKNLIQNLGYKKIKTIRGPFYLFTDIIFSLENKSN